MSKPNERSCRIFLEKLLGFPPCDPLFFVAKDLFSNFLKKCPNFFFNEIDCKKFSNFFTAEFIEKNFENFLQSISLKKNLDIFFGKFENKFFATKKKGGKSQQFFQENPT